MDIYKAIGQRIREARQAAGMSQEELGKAIGDYTATAISYFEHGLRKVKIEDIQKLAEVLGKDVSYFLSPREATEPIAQVRLRTKTKISPSHREEISDFIRFVREQKQKEGKE